MIQAPPRVPNNKRKATGSHYTPEELAAFVADQIVSACSMKAPLVLDPACGDGELLKAFRAKRPNAELNGFDLDKEALALAGERVKARLEERDFLSVALAHRKGELSAPADKFDVVIANPPYVRTQVMGADRAQEIAKAFGLKGRVDLYFAFLEGIADILRPGGIAGVIVSNRFMTTKSGATVRERILEKFDIIHIWDLGDSKLFEAAVLPAVLLLRKKGKEVAATPKMSSIYTTEAETEITAENPIRALAYSGNVRVNGDVYHVQHGTLDHEGDVWRVASDSTDDWLETVRRHTALTFGDVGKTRVGIKTTADKVFVRKTWEEPRPELLRPLLNHKAARRYKSLPPSLEILYPHTEKNGRKCAVNLDDYPISRAYLEAHRMPLERRTYVIEAGRQWFEIWVPQQPSAWNAPKLVWPDIAEKPSFWISTEGELVQGDCYWLQPASGKEELLWLALAVANSRFLETFYDRTCGNKLYAGRRRFMTQYVEKFPLPDPTTPAAAKIVETVKRIYDLTPSPEADKLAAELDRQIQLAFGVVEEVLR